MKPIRQLLLAGVLLAAAGQAATEPLGRLFLTPERRVALERQRQLNIQEEQTLEGASMSLDGIVTRSSGRSTVWVNQRPVHDSAGTGGITVTVSPKDPGRAVVAPGEEAPAQLKVGETMNRATRESRDGLGGGRVAVTRPAGH